MTSHEALREALKPFADAFERARLKYADRYKAQSIGLANFDDMPDGWDMPSLTFDMGIFRRAAEAYAALEASQPTLSGGDGMVMVPREAIKQMAERLDAGGRRLETAGNACEEVEAQLRSMIAAAPAPASNGEAVVERVARAICTENGFNPDQNIKDDTNPRWHYYRKTARAALSAINEKEGE